MTIQELDEFLVREKQKAEKALGCEMCKKYARCLYCYSRDEYRCAKAHDRLYAAMARGNRKIPTWLLPEPPLEAAPVKTEEKPAYKTPAKTEEKPAYKATLRRETRPADKYRAAYSVKNVEEEEHYDERESTEEMLETVAHILSEFNMKSLPEDRARELQKISAMMDSTEEEPPKVLYRTQRLEGDVPVLRLTRKNK